MSHTLLVAASGTSGVLLMLLGLNVMRSPRRFWARWFAIERRWRMHKFAGGWTHVETWLQRRGYFWVPRHIDLRTPDDVYAYALSDGFWRSGYAWFVRALCWYAGGLLIFFGLLVLALGLPSFT